MIKSGGCHKNEVTMKKFLKKLVLAYFEGCAQCYNSDR